MGTDEQADMPTALLIRSSVAVVDLDVGVQGNVPY